VDLGLGFDKEDGDEKLGKITFGEDEGRRRWWDLGLGFFVVERFRNLHLISK